MARQRRTTFEGDKDTYKLEQDRFEIEPALVYGRSDNFDLSLGFARQIRQDGAPHEPRY